MPSRTSGHPLTTWKQPCKATRRRSGGTPCQEFARSGQVVCRHHGGSRWSAKAAGRRRMLEFVLRGVAEWEAAGRPIPLRVFRWIYREFGIMMGPPQPFDLLLTGRSPWVISVVYFVNNSYVRGVAKSGTGRTETVAFRLPDKLKWALQERAALEHVTMAALCQRAVWYAMLHMPYGWVPPIRVVDSRVDGEASPAVAPGHGDGGEASPAEAGTSNGLGGVA